MRVFTHEGRLDAPLDAVWQFHSDVDGLLDITPGWMNLRVTGVEGSQPFTEGTEIKMEVDPPVAPRTTWTSVITEVEKGDTEARFVDEMQGGPFTSWTHTHSFRALEGGTWMRDEIQYSLPRWMLGRLGEPFFGIGMKLFFRYRLKKTNELVSGVRA